MQAAISRCRIGRFRTRSPGLKDLIFTLASAGGVVLRPLWKLKKIKEPVLKRTNSEQEKDGCSGPRKSWLERKADFNLHALFRTAVKINFAFQDVQLRFNEGKPDAAARYMKMEAGKGFAKV